MKNKLILTVTLTVAAHAVHGQALDLSFGLSALPQIYKPIPLRNNTETAPKAKPANYTYNFDSSNYPQGVVTQSKAVTPSVANTRLPAQAPVQLVVASESKITLSAVNGAIDKAPEQLTKRIYVSPKTIAIPIIKVSAITPKKTVYDIKNAGSTPPVKALDVIREPVIKQDQLQLVDLIQIDEDEYKMLHALVLFEIRKKYDIAIGLFIDLVQNSRYKTQALFHYAEIAYFFGLGSEFKTKMLQIMRNTDEKHFKRKAAESLIKNGETLEITDVDAVENFANENGISVSTSPAYSLKRAKNFLNDGELALAEQSLKQIPTQAKQFVEAKLLLATTNYRQGEVTAAINHLEAAVPQVTVDKTDKTRNLVFLTLARLYFQKGNYKQAYATYLKVDKSSSLWLQASTEQALTQVMVGDHIGAAGNMFSLHTDYFKKAYAPESYIVRAVSYLNLCQFGDAVGVVSELNRRYNKVSEQIAEYKKLHSQSADYYALIRDLFNNPDQAEVKGVPRAFIIELARHPDFLSVQKRINSFEEELAKFNSISNGLVSKANTLRQNIAQTRKEVGALRAQNPNMIQIPPLDRKILAWEYELQTAVTGREKIEKMRVQAQARMQQDKNKLKITAGEVLQKRYNEAVSELAGVLEQKEVLAYEIYSGAGEHLRYQMAGGDGKDRSPAAALTPEEKQSYKWKFRGEVWEDEIGHYRSSLTNVCPKDDYAKNTGGK